MLSLFEQLSNNRLVKSVRKNLKQSAATADDRIVAGLKAMGLATREEVLALERRVVQLEARVNVLEDKKYRAQPKPAARTVVETIENEKTGRRTIRSEASP